MMQEKKDFFKRVYQIVEKIPYGKVVSYVQIAKMLGMPKSAREVGWALRHCPDELPWQRVVRDDGTISGGQYTQLRRQALLFEGVYFLSDGRVDMIKSRWYE